MRVLMVTDFYAPFSGGVEQHVRSVAQALAARGNDVAVATMWTADAGPELEHDGPVVVHRLRTAAGRIPALFERSERPWSPPIPDPIAVRGLRRVVRSFRPEVIHGHDWLARSAWPRLLGTSAPLVLGLHYYTRTCPKKTLVRNDAPCDGPSLTRCLPCAGSHYGTAKGTIVTLGNRLGAAIDDRACRHWLPVSAATAEGNGLRPGTGCTVVPNPLPPGAMAAEAGSSVELPPAVPTTPFLLFVGGLRPEKGIDVLLAAHRMLPDAPPLVLAGERVGPRPAVDGPRVIELGEQPNDVVQALWRAARIGIVPSTWAEPFGIVVIEALAAGCPLVASAIGGLPEILAHERSALLVPPGDVAALAGAIARLDADAELRQRLSAAGRAAAAAYEPDVVAERIESIYRGVVDG